MAIKKILVPTDFSKEAQLATDVSADIAKKNNAELVLLHVVEEATSNSFNVEGEVASMSETWENKIFTLKLLERAKKQLAKALADPKLSDVKVRTELRIGSPFHGMRTIIGERKVDLVVMGTAGHSKLEEMIIGSNTEKVIRHANCPVL